MSSPDNVLAVPTMDIGELIYMKLPGLLHPAYGYVLLIVFIVYMLAFVQGFMVGRMRTKYKVELPAMYSDTEPMFNCYQRVHQNTLERIPLFLCILLLAGCFNSIITAVIGGLWVIGRIVYSVGYYSGVPNNRIAGSLVSSISTIYFCNSTRS
jgi:glutathione S-transferase